MRLGKNDRVLQPVHPNQGIEAAYRSWIRKLIDAMHKDVLATIRSCYAENEPEIAQDAKKSSAELERWRQQLVQEEEALKTSRVLPRHILRERELLRLKWAAYQAEVAKYLAQDALPTTVLTKAINEMVKKWQKRFDRAAPKLAKYFAQDVSKRSDACLQKILKDAGFTVKFKMTKAAQDVMAATIQQQVGLIKSIPTQYLGQVQGEVMRSVQAGRDLATLTDELTKNYQVTRKRAALIARDQNNKATAAITRARRLDLGITKAIWVHSGGGKEPRPTHLKASKDRVQYDIQKGWYDPHEKKYIHPGELINCRCVSKPVIEGFS